jgi:predicted secreted protein
MGVHDNLEEAMKTKSLILAALMVPAIATAQVAPAGQKTKPAFEKMQANVAQITVVGEKQRWQANVAMWQTVIAKPGAPSTAEIAGLRASLMTINANVAEVTRPAEMERWRANIALWRAFIRAGKVQPPTGPAIDAAFNRMKGNVSKITDPAEKERWQANIDLWQEILTPQP